jgi:hypothetical protein
LFFSSFFSLATAFVLFEALPAPYALLPNNPMVSIIGAGATFAKL